VNKIGTIFVDLDFVEFLIYFLCTSRIFFLGGTQGVGWIYKDLQLWFVPLYVYVEFFENIILTHTARVLLMQPIQHLQ